MAAPAEMTTADISGTYIMNKALTDGTKTDEILRLQGVSWLTRRIISAATVTLYVKHSQATADSPEHIHIDQRVTGGISADPEDFYLNWTERHTDNRIFGALVIKSRRTKVEDLENGWLKDGWTSDTIEHGVIESKGDSDTPKSGTTWTAHQAWGFQGTGEERRYTRNVQFTGPQGENIQVKMYYDYQGPAQ